MEELNYWQRLARRRVSRRALLGASATTALGGAAAMIVGCGGGGDNGGGGSATPHPTASAPVFGGTITQGRPVTILGIDPHIDLTGLDIDTYLYPYLYGWAPNREQVIFNNLAVMETPDPDNLVFIFSLNQGVKNSPWTEKKVRGANAEITSTDCKASFIRRGTSISAPDKRFPRKIGRDENAMDAAIETPDPYTFKFTMTEPFVPAIREMANPTWAIVSQTVIEDTLGKGLSQVAYGAGPFMLDEDGFRGNERVVLKKNPNYFKKPLPYLDGLTTVIITENSSLLTAFKQGQHDVCGAVLTKEDYDEFVPNSDYATFTAPNLFYPCVHLKVIRQPFDQIKVREAIDISINRDEIISIIQNDRGAYNGPIQWAQTKWALPQDELKEFYKYDPDRAKSLLADAGYPNGFKSTMKLPKITGVSFIADIASLLKDQWSRVGINVELEEVELGTFIGSTLLPGNFDMAFFPNLPYDEPDRPLSFYSSLGVTGSGNWTNYSNPELDKLIEKQSQQFVESERQATILEAQRMILKEHGPQLTLTGDYAYSARWWYVHYPYNLGEDPNQDVNPNGVDIWSEKPA
ncbi:MAG TPA: ABC transporter substrate-binding protein [Dehalococcoidia bacterium]|nr:ABC transporter substrate-binding protein [Dehalococcoidia bacterium]